MAEADLTGHLGVLKQVRVLIIEDEPFIAFDLVCAVEDAGGEPVGPAATVAQALDLVAASTIHAAILDVNLPDGHVGPVIEALHGKAVMVVHTGLCLPPEIKARFPDVPVYVKPTPTSVLVQRLAGALRPIQTA